MNWKRGFLRMWAVASLAWVVAVIQPAGEHQYRQYCYEKFGQYACLVPVPEGDEFAGFLEVKPELAPPPGARIRQQAPLYDDGWRMPSSLGLWLLIVLPPLVLLGAGAALSGGANTIINWDRGLLRLWLVLSLLWIIGALFWMESDANKQVDSMVQLLCRPLEMTFEEWQACYQKAQRSYRGGTWFENRLREHWWALPGGTFLIAFALVVAAGLWKVVAWVGRGFVRNPN